MNQLLELTRERVERSLSHWLPSSDTHPARLHEAMRYAMLGSGKRIRPALVYATGKALSVDFARLDGPACAVELIHGYSLVHDDLPAMDDDDLRRGRPTCHKVFGDAMAILAGDALQTLAFYVLSHDRELNGVAPQTRLAMVESLALASGSRGMAGGQAIDLQAVGRELDLTELENMHIHKTGALIRTSVRLGALCCDCASAEVLQGLDRYAKCIGLAFQIQDDILDVEGSTETLGKSQGKDHARDKPTYTSLLGLDGAREKAEELKVKALDSLAPLGNKGEELRSIARFIVSRPR
ncbi:MAG: (2E,6E)-farnesyl diphosphate synthase [Chromatiales bacterium]|nr:(2E,6E)-farnesyl diphosphate synthase [Chromatiales bacterium]